jgi:hypothetical protein
MFTIRFSPFSTSQDDYEFGSNRETFNTESDEYGWKVKYPLDYDTFRKILSEELEHVNYTNVWSLPLERDEFPEDGLSLVFITTYKDTSIDRSGTSKYVRTFVGYNCSVYIMNDNGRTIDRIS